MMGTWWFYLNLGVLGTSAYSVVRWIYFRDAEVAADVRYLAKKFGDHTPAHRLASVQASMIAGERRCRYAFAALVFSWLSFLGTISGGGAP